MKIKHLLPIAALAIPAFAFARPANPELVIKMQNPDGTIVEVRNHGDERFNYYTLANDETIIERNSLGYWNAAIREGRMMMANRVQDIELLRSEVRPMDFSPIQKPATRMAPIDKEEGRTTFPTLATDVHSLVVLLEYSDTPFTVPNPKQAFEDMLNKEGYDAYGSCGSARDYYIAASNGKFAPTFDVTDIIKLSKPSAYYTGAGTNLNSAGRAGRFGEAIAEALKQLQEQGMDFSKYDYDGDGDIDTIFFFYSGYGQADSKDTNTIWPHQADFERYTLPESQGGLGLEPIYLNGKRMGPYACSNELNANIPPTATQPYLDGIGAFCHEFGHVLGLPDLYDTTNSSTKVPGKYSIMDTGSYNNYSVCPPTFSGYERWVCHWLEFDDLDENGCEVSLEALTKGHKASRVLVRLPKVSPLYYKDEFFVLETRGNDTWDEFMPQYGMLIWHIQFDHSIWISNLVNSNKRPHVELLYASSGTNPTIAWGNTANASYVHPGMANGLIPTSPVFETGKLAYGNYLTNINYNPETLTTTLRFNLDKELCEDVTSFRAATRPENDAQQFTLSWDPVEGADGYFLTCYYMTPGGQKSYVENMNEGFVKGNSYTFTDFFSSMWNNQLRATVRVLKKYPSEKVSEEYTFIPSQLSPSGIDEIGSEEAVIYGGNGEVVAPEGAEVFNLSGVRTGKTDLPAGVYIVRYGKQTAKVVVK